MVDSEGEDTQDEHHQRTGRSRDDAAEALEEKPVGIDAVAEAFQRDLKLDGGGDLEDEASQLLAEHEDPVSEEPQNIPTCEDWTVEKICEGLKTDKFKNIIVFIIMYEINDKI